SPRALDDWTTEVLTRGQGANLTAFLRRQDLSSGEEIREISRYSVPCSYGRINQFQPQTRDARGRPFFPGSAIKGALRAAVLWKLVDREAANGYVRERRGDRSRFYARELDERSLQSYRLPGRDFGRAGPHFDLMRAVKVSDGYGSLETRVEKIVVQSYVEGRDGGRRATLGAGDTIYAECVSPGSWVEFDLKVDEKILGDFRKEKEDLPFADEASLLELARGFYGEVWGFERRYYGLDDGSKPDAEPAPPEVPDFATWLKREKGLEALSRRQRKPYEAEYKRAFDLFDTAPSGGGRRERSEARPARSGGVGDGEVRLGKVRGYYAGACPGFRIGWGSGLASTTVDMRLEPENMGKVLRLMNSQHHRGEPIDGPRSRKLVEANGGASMPMGWAKLEVR
ncbi:MAG: type III-A CRISPR-associated RAMP protein Csm5, partial [Actinomycetota bacterium]|nr:type III-A CRISPR-associated RAMP protein Csm5 [Actinomycetota bacterium]